MKKTLWLTFVLAAILIFTFSYFVIFGQNFNTKALYQQEEKPKLFLITELANTIIKRTNGAEFVKKNQQLIPWIEKLRIVSNIENQDDTINEMNMSILKASATRLESELLKLRNKYSTDDLYNEVLELMENLNKQIMSIVEIENLSNS